MTLPPDRIRYNKSVINSDLQQALLNIVRLRYGDTPNFLSVNSIVSQFNVDGSIASDPSRTFIPLIGTNYNVNLSLKGSFSESPTITYTPMQGEEFVTRLLTPVDIKVIKLFLRDGWGIAHIFRIFLQHLGGMDNAVIASRPSSHRMPKYKEFAEFTKILRKLQIEEQIHLYNDTELEHYRLRVEISSFRNLNANQLQLLARLGITPKYPKFWISSEPEEGPHNFYAETRTVLSIYSFLSKGVNVPKSHEDVVKVVRYPDGRPFDWREIVGGLIEVKSSKLMPAKAYISIYYRGYYFYIDDRDDNSKETMHLLMILNGIFQGNIQSVLPVFTVS